MIYEQILEGIFIERPNRFIAIVDINGQHEKVHVMNTGRCKELLTPNAKVYVNRNNNPNRKTKYSLISVYKGDKLINMDSQVPNKVVYDGIISKQIDILDHVSILLREKTYKDSRFDMYFEQPLTKSGTNKKLNIERGYIEVKGVTLESEGIAMFPDAPTERGTKHIYGLIDAVENGYKGILILLIQMSGVGCFRPNKLTDPKLSEALTKASRAGVIILAYDSIVLKDEIRLGNPVQVRLYE